MRQSLSKYIILCVLLLILACPIASADDLTDQAIKNMKQRSTLWKCKVTKQFGCTPDGCDERKPDLEISIDFDKNIYKRCVGFNCDSHKLKSKQWGIYSVLNFEREGGAYFMAVNDGSEFTESITQGVWTLSGFGKCVPWQK